MTRITLVLLMLVTAHARCQAQRNHGSMDIIFYRTDVEKPIPLTVEPTAIQPAVEGGIHAEAMPEETELAYTRPFSNAQRNARLPATVDDGPWSVRWQASLDQAFPPQFVLSIAHHVIVQQDEAWQLFDGQGTPLAQGARSLGDIVLDAEHRLFYINDHTGLVVARDLSSGEEAYALFPMFGAGYIRSVLVHQEQRLWMVGTELPVMSHRAQRPPEYTILEVQDLGTPLQKDEDGILISNQRVETLITRPVPMLTAAQGQTLVLAAPGHVFLVDEALQVFADLQGTFTPLAMSLDEAGRIYLIVHAETESGAERHALWILTPKGERVVDVEIPAHPSGAYTPPIVGYDHRVYVLLGDRVMAIAPEGDVLWEKTAGAPIAGAVVTADHQLLVTAGGLLFIFDAEGERNGLFYLEDDHWTTPPVLTDRQRILVASERHLYCLQIQQ